MANQSGRTLRRIGQGSADRWLKSAWSRLQFNLRLSLNLWGAALFRAWPFQSPSQAVPVPIDAEQFPPVRSAFRPHQTFGGRQ